MKKIILNISGMHCKSCEKLLEDEISAIPNIKKVRASFKKNSLEVSFDEKPDMAGIARIIEKCGYKIGKPEKNREPRRFWQWFLAAVITTAILLLFRYFRDTGIADMINIQKPNLNFEISFLVGLVASISSCLAVVGGVIIAFAQKYKTENNDFLRGAFIPNMIFHIGRMSTFFILGGLLGLIGGEVNINGNFVSIYTIIISAI
ncbi:MAG TPA: cation transporter, partial [Patescibacteria group bacterium]|nr:cation transporter [Patescibacteria group bacterium]